MNEIDAGQAEMPTSNEKLSRLMLDSVTDCAIFATDVKGRVTSWNAGAKRLFGYAEAEMTGRTASVLFTPEDAERGVPEQEIQTAATKGRAENKRWHIRKDGTRFWMSGTVTPLRDEAGTLCGFVKVGRDLTCLKAEEERAEEPLRASQRMFCELVDALPIAVYVCDSSGAIESYNKCAVELWGRAPNIRDIADSFYGSYKIYTLDGTYLPYAACPMAQVLRTGKTLSNKEIVIERPDGSRRTVMVNILPRRDERGNQTGAINCLTDVTERLRAEQERAQLLQHLVTAQEDERYRIARELHDQTGQYLAALMLGLKSLDDCAPSSLSNSSGGNVRRLQELTAQFSREMRNFAIELRPTSLDDLGLHTALANYVDEWSERYGLAVDFHSNGFIKQRLPPHIETALYRIVQEALTNVLKHAGAQRVSIIMEYRGGRVLAVLEDDGRGFNVDAALDAPVAERGLGLTGMKERVELVNGTLEIESSPGTGTTLAIRIPIAPYEEKGSNHE